MLSMMAVACSNAQEGESTSGDDKVIVELVSADAFKELMKVENSQLIDVRTPEEYAQGKIGDAKNINFYDGDFRDRIAGLDKKAPVLIYCASGGRSGKAVSMMKEMGFVEIHELKGGYRAWK